MIPGFLYPPVHTATEELCQSIYLEYCYIVLKWNEMIGVLGHILHCKAKLGREQAELMWWILLLNHAPGARYSNELVKDIYIYELL